MPIMVMQNNIPNPICDKAIGIPPINNQITFIIKHMQPLDEGESNIFVPKGTKATRASFMVCNPNGMPIMVSIITMLNTTYSMAMISPPNTIHIMFKNKFIIGC